MVYVHKEPERVYPELHDEHDVPLYEAQLGIVGTHKAPATEIE